MITPNPLLGTLYHGVGALSSSACYMPQKKVRGWSWHTYWLTQAAFCWLLLPILGAILTIPHLATVLAEAPHSAMLTAFLLGMAYGIGGTAFGLSIRHIGFSLTYAISIGLSSVLGAIIPPLLKGTLVASVEKPGGSYIVTGIAIGVVGIAITGAAGRIKELGLRKRRDEAPSFPATPGVEASSSGTAEELSQKSPKTEPEFSMAKGLLISIAAGVLSAFYGFALTAGQPIADVALRHGAGVFDGNVTFIFANSGAFLTTLIYCGVLHVRHKSVTEFVTLPKSEGQAQLKRNFLFSTLTGILWYGQFFFYNLGHVHLGKAYDFTSWTLHMTMLVLFSSIWALILREWKGTRRSAQALFCLSMVVLVFGVFSLTYGNYLGSAQ